ncbi:MAG: 2-hydroxychromene-2-carboxylate isomerase [Myxococcales bacterium]|nr:2-hydroxychromene-2-carboxylate isomerase [Myxococcales bacterium]
MPVDFYFDYASPFAYLASETLASRLPSTEIRFRPVYLRGFDLFAKGVPFSPAKTQYLARDFHRCADHHGVPHRFPSNFPINGLYALRGATWTLKNGGFERFHAAAYRAAWAEDRNIGDKSVVIEIANEAGLDWEAFAAGIDSPEIKDQLKAATAEAEARGAFGVPTFFVGDAMFWGHDRMDYVARAARGEA